MPGSLAHLRVLDLSRVLAGPWAGQALADLGADVVKVERPGQGDDTRGWGPPYLKDADGRDTSEAAYFLAANRGKRSLTLDIASPRGGEVARALAARADVVLENYKVGTLAKYGLDYASLKAINPGLVYCSITGFGQDGPYAARAGYDFMIQGMAGLMSVTGEPDGPPEKAGVALVDILTGLNATIAVLAALAHRDRTGEGQAIDMALFDVMVASMANQATNYLSSGRAPRRLGNAHPNIVPYQVFATSDGHIILAVGNDGQFQKFCAVAGRPEIAADPRFARNADRVRNRAELIPILETAIRERPSASWLEALERQGVPCGPINDMAEVFADPQAEARGLRVEMPHPAAGTVPLVASPFRLSATPVEYRRPPPLLGQHAGEVLADWLELGEDAIDDLRRAAVI
ncbi:CaiB/BaiF CoA transferase family protein [Arenibaculum pallidiluteum]|uniref:CaiB/BaiF CoA transferase family protein n=1 Tax=Arenibaculum pallidiluteum TaxID=2812559 RepID=UPI001A96D9E4|nr:CaiB/BaiF CoA-transferase family protein [Arenibaculum pallidiluteum]